MTERHAEIARVDEDYFLFSGREIEVDGQPTRHLLLRDGNRISFSRNARLTFRMPHRASPSGIMDLGSSTKMPHGVRRVILFRKTAMIGFGKSSHIHCNAAQRDLLLFERDGGLWIRPQRNGRGDAEQVAVIIGKPMDVYGVGIVVQPWTAAPSGPSFS